MSTVTLRIQVDKAGASENIGAVKRDLQGMGETGAQAGAQASTGVNGLSSAINGAKAAVGAFLAVYAGIQALSGVVRLADEYQGLTDRLKLATGGSAEFEAAQAGVFAIAQQTGTALSAVGDLYVSLANSTRDLGLSQGELQTITQAVSQSFVVSGASAASTDAAIRQLGQAFSKGKLNGDEFVSMSENAPVILDALAAALGKTRGELAQMAEAGTFTKEVLATGLLAIAPDIADKFGQMGTTVGRAFTQLSNAVLKFVGEASQSTGAANALATVIVGIANSLPAFAFGLTAVAAGYAAVSAAALVANPAIGFTATLLAGAATAMGVLIAAYAGYKLGEYFVNEFAIVQAAVRSLYVGLNDAWTAIKIGAQQAVAAVRIAFITAFDAITDRLADLIDAFVELSEIELPFGLRADFAYGQAEAMTELARRVRDTTDAVVENDAVTGDLKSEMGRARAEAERYAADMFDAVDSLKAGKTATEGTTGATKLLTPAVVAATKATEAATKGNKDVKSAFDGVTGSINVTAGAFEGITGSIEVFVDDAGKEALRWAEYWQGANEAILSGFGDLFSGGIDSLEDFGDEMLRISQRIVSDMVSEFARTGRIQIAPGMFGAGGTGSTLGGWLSSIGTAYGALQNARNGGSALSTIGGFAVSGAQIAGPVGAAIGAIVGGLVAAFSGDKNPLLRVRSSEFSGPRRSEGRATSQLGNIFIRTENTPDGAGTSPEIAQRIADFDNLLAGFLSADQLSAVRGALANVNDTFENGAFTIENALGARFGAILGALDSNIQEFVGSTGTLEQRVSRLTDALTIAAIAAGDNGISGSFEDLADLLTRFRLQGEGVADTFGRLSFGVGLIDDTLLMLGGTFRGTRLQAANFAGELINLAGGLDQFSARLNGALEALFSEPERNQFMADQALAALNSSLRGLNITGTGVDSIREQLRTQLRDALAAGNSALVNELLIAGNALGAFATAVGRLGDTASGALTGTVFGSTPGNAGTIGPGQLNAGAGTAAQTQLGAAQTTNTILNTQTGLLQRIALNTDRGVALTPKAGGDQTAVLVQIKALIEQAVRAQISESLKRTTGANKRTTAA